MKKIELERQLEMRTTERDAVALSLHTIRRDNHALEAENKTLSRTNLVIEKRISFLEGELRGVRYPVGATLPEDRATMSCDDTTVKPNYL